MAPTALLLPLLLLLPPLSNGSLRLGTWHQQRPRSAHGKVQCQAVLLRRLFDWSVHPLRFRPAAAARRSGSDHSFPNVIRSAAIYSFGLAHAYFQTSERGRFNSRVSSQCIDSLLFFNGGASSLIYEPRRPHHIIHSLLLRPQRPPRCLLDAPPASTLRSSKSQAMPLAIQ